MERLADELRRQEAQVLPWIQTDCGYVIQRPALKTHCRHCCTVYLSQLARSFRDLLLCVLPVLHGAKMLCCWTL